MQKKSKYSEPKFCGDEKKYTLDYFDHLTAEENEQKIVDLKKKQREINERAKKRF